MASRVKVILGLVALAALLALFNLTGFANSLKNFFYSFSQPFQKLFGKAGNDFSDFLAGVFQAGSLKKENENLQSKIQELVGEKIKLQELGKENEVLREALKLGLEKDFQLTLAKITGKDVFQDSLLLDKGRDDGLVSGLPVITPQKVLLGKIGEVFPNFSKVILLSNKESVFDVKLGDKEIFGAAKGRGGNVISLELILREKEVEQGDIVTTAALGNIFPPHLLVGQVQKAEKADVEPFQKIEVKPAFEFEAWREVFVILN